MAISDSLRDEIRKRAGYQCEYCHYPEKATTSVLHLEHILPQEAQGRTTLDNLALACPNCNLHKSNKRTVLDPQNGERVRLFNPREDNWNQHFLLKRETGEVVGLTSTGRATVKALGMDAPQAVQARKLLIQRGIM